MCYTLYMPCAINGLESCLCWFDLEGRDEVNITIEIKPDDTPEVPEIFNVNLFNASDLDRLQTGAVSTCISRGFELADSK